MEGRPFEQSPRKAARENASTMPGNELIGALPQAIELLRARLLVEILSTHIVGVFKGEGIGRAK
jgi:hypothetical protein